MLNYIKGEGYRITHSRGMYVAAGMRVRAAGADESGTVYKQSEYYKFSIAAL